jgi:hypothetical protein
VIKRADQFKIPAPLPLNSDAYAKELNEVKLLGGDTAPPELLNKRQRQFFLQFPLCHSGIRQPEQPQQQKAII